MIFWNELYIELAEKIIGLKECGSVNTLEELEQISEKRDGDCYQVLDQLNINNEPFIFRYTERMDGEHVIFQKWINTQKTTFVGSIPEIKWVDLWHEQVNFLTEELPFTTPAVFISLGVNDTEDLSNKVQNCDTQVDFYVYYETFSDTSMGSYNQETAVEFLNILTKLHALFHAGSGVNYSNMRRIDMKREDAGGAGNLYRISFECLTTDYAASVLFNEEIVPERSLEFAKENEAENQTESTIYEYDVVVN